MVFQGTLKVLNFTHFIYSVFEVKGMKHKNSSNLHTNSKVQRGNE